MSASGLACYCCCHRDIFRFFFQVCSCLFRVISVPSGTRLRSRTTPPWKNIAVRLARRHNDKKTSFKKSSFSRNQFEVPSVCLSARSSTMSAGCLPPGSTNEAGFFFVGDCFAPTICPPVIDRFRENSQKHSRSTCMGYAASIPAGGLDWIFHREICLPPLLYIFT